MPPGVELYPKGLTREGIETYVKTHPEERSAIYGERTVVVRDGERLSTIPYHVAYKEFLDPAARALEEAAELSDDPAFARFLKLRAQALLSDDYYASDVAWVELADPRFDLILAPYETYLDGLLGVKGSYGAAVLIRNDEESGKLAVFQKYVPEIQDSLLLPAEDRPSQRGKSAPMEVMDAPFRSGDLRHGYQAVADNLPNDPRIHQEKGSKRIFFKNYMDARVREIIVPLARRLLREEDAAKASADGYLIGTLMHEIAHGLGPAWARAGGRQTSIREAIPAPALKRLATRRGWPLVAGERKALPPRTSAAYTSFVADLFRTVRLAPPRRMPAEMMEFNFPLRGYHPRALRLRDPVREDARVLKASREPETEPPATASAPAWFAKYDAMPADRLFPEIPTDVPWTSTPGPLP
jgi:hypothetical protein